MKKSLLVLGLFLGSLLSLSAEEVRVDTHREAAEKLLEICRFDSSVNLMQSGFIESVKQSNPISDDQEQRLKDFFGRCFSLTNLREEAIQLYTDLFTEQELKEVAIFYGTPVGQKTIEKMPEIMQRCVQIGQSQVMQNIAELEQLFSEENEG